MSTVVFNHHSNENNLHLFDYRLKAIFRSSEILEKFKNWSKTKTELPMGNNECIALVESAMKELQLTDQQMKMAEAELHKFKTDLTAVSLNMNPQARGNAKAFFWPDPTMNQDQDIYDTLPYAQTYPFVDASTKIVSMGSCFASEIARELQSRNFNYLITENASDPDRGIFSRDHDPQNPRVPFSAAWGLIFNTPSFKQLSEKAFGIRDTARLLTQVEGHSKYGNCFYDPFRENMVFMSREAYEKNYETHRQACRRALTEADVIVLTFGLNECWEFISSGDIAAVAPKSADMISLMRPRILTVQENMNYMQSFVDLVRQHNPKVKFIVSVSPVPFSWTVRLDRHAIAANTHSKSVLRVVAEELSLKNSDLYYFPSYETVTRCVKRPWEEDERHVRPQAVKQVMKLFDAMFVKPEVRLATESKTLN